MPDVVVEPAPSWRVHQPRRMVAASWPTLSERVEGREVELSVLPGVRLEWFERGIGYRGRRLALTAVLFAVAATFSWFDIAFIRLAARVGSATSLIAVVVVLFLAGAFFAWRPDLFVARESTRPRPPVVVMGVLLVVGAIGRLTTPGWVLVSALDQLHRFPMAERAAWLAVLDQLSSAPVRSAR